MYKMDINNFDKIIIYQFGKVGSSTLWATFSKYKETRHTHYFNKNMLKGNTLIINVVRNLFDRNISALFECINYKPIRADYIIPKDGKHIREGVILYTEKREVNDMINFFREVNIEKLLKIRYKNWYTYFNEQLGINIFSDPFDTNKKYDLYKTDNITVIILRFEDIDDWENILNTLFTQEIKLKSENLTNQKNIYDLYTLFKKNYKYSDEEINLIKEIDFMKKYYTEDEITKFIKKYNN